MDTISIQEYTSKSFIVLGNDTKLIKENLKNMGGKWNSNLKDENGGKFGAWIFSNKRLQEVEEFLSSEPFITPKTTPKRLLSPPKIISKKKYQDYSKRIENLELKVNELFDRLSDLEK